MSGAASGSRGNPFSIDYILSNAKQPATPVINQDQAQLLDQLNLMQQQQQRFMAALAAPSKSSFSCPLQPGNSGDAALPPLGHLASPTAAALDQLKLNELQQHQRNPNFLYFMACMLLQQQQALRQQQQMQRSQQRPQAMNPIEILAQLTANANLAAVGGAWQQFGKQQQTANLVLPKPVGGGQSRPAYLLQQSAPSVATQPPAYSPLVSLHHVFADCGAARPAALPPPPPPPTQAENTAKPRCLLSPKVRTLHGKASVHETGTGGGHSQQQPGQQHSSRGDKLDNLKPAHSYIGLIGMCILSTPEKRMVLNDIYQYILDHYPYYRNRGSGWRNSVRHNLSLNECFQKAGRAANGKGHYWTIHPANMEDFMNGDFRRRRAQRKVRRWNNMDVPSDESDDESTEDANRPPLPEHFKRSLQMHRRLETMGYGSAAVAAAAAAHFHHLSQSASAPPLVPPTVDTNGGGPVVSSSAGNGSQRLLPAQQQQMALAAPAQHKMTASGELVRVSSASALDNRTTSPAAASRMGPPHSQASVQQQHRRLRLEQPMELSP